MELIGFDRLATPGAEVSIDDPRVEAPLGEQLLQPLPFIQAERRLMLPGNDVSTSDAAKEDPFNDDWWRDAWADYTDFDRYPEEAEYGYIRDF